MAADLQLQLRSTAGDTTFDVDGEFRVLPREREFKESADPPQLKRIVERWQFTGCLIVGADTETLWDNLLAFLAKLEDRSTSPFTSARIVRDPTGAAVVERTLGPSPFQRFRVEEVGLSPPDVLRTSRRGAWRVVAAIDLTVSAELPLADADGLLDLRQTVVDEYRDGLRTLEWRTEVETAEGTDAAALARTFGKIPIAEFGDSFFWRTNGPDGVDVTVLDADERSSARGSAEPSAATSRVPTSVRAVSRIEQRGISLGANNPGNSPNDQVFTVETEIQGNEQSTIWRAEARGPNALVWVQSKRPAGSFSREFEFEDQTRRIARAEWERSEQNPRKEGQAGTRSELSVAVSGGDRIVDFVPIDSANPPRQVVGARQVTRLELEVTLTFIGANPTRQDMLFPPILAAPLVLDRENSRWALNPELVQEAADPENNQWERKASLIYLSATAIDPDSIRQQLEVVGVGIGIGVRGVEGYEAELL